MLLLMSGEVCVNIRPGIQSRHSDVQVVPVQTRPISGEREMIVARTF